MHAITAQPIPESLYWQPSERTPAAEQLSEVWVACGGVTVLTYKLSSMPKDGSAVYLRVNRCATTSAHLIHFVRLCSIVCSICDRNYRLAFYYCKSDVQVPTDENMSIVYPTHEFPAMPTVDALELRYLSTPYFA